MADEGTLDVMYKTLKADKNYANELPSDVNEFKSQLQDSATANQFFSTLKQDKNYSSEIPDNFHDFYSQIEKKNPVGTGESFGTKQDIIQKGSAYDGPFILANPEKPSQKVISPTGDFSINYANYTPDALNQPIADTDQKRYKLLLGYNDNHQKAISDIDKHITELQFQGNTDAIQQLNQAKQQIVENNGVVMDNLKAYQDQANQVAAAFSDAFNITNAATGNHPTIEPEKEPLINQPPQANSFEQGAESLQIGLMKGFESMANGFDGIEKALVELTGGKHEGGTFKDIADIIRSQREQVEKVSERKGTGFAVTEQIGELIPMLLQVGNTAKLMNMSKGAPALIQQFAPLAATFATNSFGQTYQSTGSVKQASIASAKGIGEAGIMTALGLPSRLAASYIANPILKGITKIGVESGTFGLYEKGREKIMNEPNNPEAQLQNVVLGGVMGAHGLFSEAMAHYANSDKDFIESITKSDKMPEQMREIALENADKAIAEPDQTKKEQYAAAANISNVSANIKAIDTFKNEDPQTFIQTIAASDIPQEAKDAIINNSKITDLASNKSETLNAKIKSIDKSLQGIANSNAFSEPEKVAHTKILETKKKELQEQINQLYLKPEQNETKSINEEGNGNAQEKSATKEENGSDASKGENTKTAQILNNEAKTGTEETPSPIIESIKTEENATKEINQPESVQGEHKKGSENILHSEKIEKINSYLSDINTVNAIQRDRVGSEFGVKAIMNNLIDNNKIIKIIIPSIPVNMVDDFIGKKSSSQDILSNPNVFSDAISSNRNIEIGRLFFSRYIKGITGFGTKLFDFLSTGRIEEFNSTVKAAKLNLGEVVRLLSLNDRKGLSMEDINSVFSKTAPRTIFGNSQSIGKNAISTPTEFANFFDSHIANIQKDFNKTSGSNSIFSTEASKKEQKIGVSHAETADLRTKYGLEDREVAEFLSDKGLQTKASEMLDSGFDVNKVSEKVKNGTQPSPEERAAVILKIARLDTELSDLDPLSKEYESKLKELKVAINANDQAASMAGKSLGMSAIKILRDDNLPDMFIREMNVSGVSELTDKQKQQVIKEFEEIKTANDEYQKKIQSLEAENSKLRAGESLRKNRPAEPRIKKTKESFQKERENILKNISEKLAKKNSMLSASPIPYADSLVEIAPDVAKLVKSYLEQGVNQLGDIVKKIHDDVKSALPEITEKDINDIIAGEYKVKKQTKNELSAKLKDLHDEAVLINKLDGLLKGEVPKTERRRIERNQQIKELQEKIKDFHSEKAAEIQRAKDEQKEKERKIKEAAAEEERLIRELEKEKKIEERNKIKVKIAESKRIQKELAYKTPEESALQSLKTRTTNQISSLQEDLRTGNFTKTKTVKPKLKLDKEAIELKNKVIKLKKEQQIRQAEVEFERLPKWQKGFYYIDSILGLRRAIQTAFDYSVPFRQAIRATINPFNYKQTAKSFENMFKHSFSEEKMNAYYHDLENSPDYHEMKADKLEITDMLSKNEELFINNLAAKLPLGIGIGYKMSQRAVTAYLNTMRIEMYRDRKRALEATGITRENSPEGYKFMADGLNKLTGRGNIGSLAGKPEKILSRIFFGPRMMAAKFQLLTGFTDARYYKSEIPKEVKMRALRDLAGYMATYVGVALAANAMGWKVSLNPNDPDFLKLKHGDTRYDITGGEVIYVRTFLRIMGAAIDRIQGRQDGIKAAKKAGESVGSFFRNKLSPNTSYAMDYFYGKKTTGQPFAATDILKYYPMWIDDIVDDYKQDGNASILATGVPAIFGVGTQTYKSGGNTTHTKTRQKDENHHQKEDKHKSE